MLLQGLKQKTIQKWQSTTKKRNTIWFGKKLAMINVSGTTKTKYHIKGLDTTLQSFGNSYPISFNL